MAQRARYFGNSIKLNGAAIEIVPNSSVTVYEAGTLTPVSAGAIFAANTGGTTLGNPFVTDSLGNINFYLASPRRVKLVVTGVDVGPLTADYEPVLPDPADLVVSGQTTAVDLAGGLSLQRNDAADWVLNLRAQDTTTALSLLVRNAENTADFVAVRRISGNDVLGIGVAHATLPSTSTMFVYKSIPSGPGYVVSDVVLDTAGNGDYGATRAVARQLTSGNASIRSGEFQTLRGTGTGPNVTWGIEIGVHSQVAPTLANHNLGIYLASTHTGWLASGVRNGTALFIGGEDGWSDLIRYYDTDGATILTRIDQAGKMTGGHLFPRAADAYTLGDLSSRWNVFYGNFLAIGDGLAAGPSITFLGDTDTGFWRSATKQIGVSNNGVLSFHITSAGLIDWRRSQNIAPGGGSTLTMAGATGGSGPATATIAGFIKQQVNGVNIFTPYWV